MPGWIRQIRRAQGVGDMVTMSRGVERHDSVQKSFGVASKVSFEPEKSAILGLSSSARRAR
jgi:hypothetical protein